MDFVKLMNDMDGAYQSEDPEAADWADINSRYDQAITSSPEPYVAALRDPDPEVRQAAAWVLGHMPRKSVAEPLLDALEDGDIDVKCRIIWALGRKRAKQAFGHLVALLSDQNARVRTCAASALGHIESPESVKPLIVALDDECAEVREAAASSLGSLVIFSGLELDEWTDQTPVEPLIKLLRDPSADARRAAASTLGFYKAAVAFEPLLKLLEDPDTDVLEAAASSLAQIDADKAAAPLLAAIENTPEDERHGFLLSLAATDHPAALDYLTKELQSPDPSNRLSAAVALSSIASSQAMDALKSAVNDPDDEVRAAVIRAIDDPEDLSLLLAALNDESADVQVSAICGMGKIGTPEAIQALIEKLGSTTEPYVRNFIAMSLSEQDDPAASQVMIDALERRDVDFVAFARRFYISRSIEDAVPLLIEAMETQQSWPMAHAIASDLVACGYAPLVEAARRYGQEHFDNPEPRMRRHVGVVKWGEAV